MSILVISKYGDGAGLAWKMHKQGHPVTLFVKERYASHVMDGLVPKAHTLEEALKAKPTVILFDMSGMGELADDLAKNGHKVIGASKQADKLELDRSYGVKVARQFGLTVPRTEEFSSVDEAIAFVKKEPKAWAIKLDDNQGTSSSYVSKDGPDMIAYLSYQKEEGKLGKGTFILQEKIEGAEISTELWLSQGVPVWSSANSTAEDKRLISDGVGPRTGCESSFVFPYESGTSEIVNQTVRPLLPLLKHLRWTGPIDVNSIISPKDKKAYFLELTPRCGWSALYAYVSILGMPLGEFLERMGQGHDFRVSYKAKWGSSLKVSVPPYPLEGDDASVQKLYSEAEGIRIQGKLGDDFIPVDCKKGKNGQLVAAGTSGIIGECLGRGHSLMQAWKASQAVFNDLEIPNKMGRVKDGAENCWKRINDLRKMGFSEVPNPISGAEAKGDITPLSTKAKVPVSL